MINKEHAIDIFKSLTTGAKHVDIMYSYMVAKKLHMNKIEYLTYITKNILISKFPDILEYLNKNLKENYNIIDIYNFLYNKTGICEICGKKLEFISFARGYETCDNLYFDLYSSDNINNKLDFIKKYSTHASLISLIDFCNKYFKLNIKYDDAKTYEDIYLKIGGEKHVCECNNCNKHTKFLSISSDRHYKQFCSDVCRNKWWSMKQHVDNTYKRIPDDKKAEVYNNISVRIKKSIADGTFIPQITNSWCHSKYEITYYNKDKCITKKVRSAWEAMFLLMNPKLEYEQLRIPYIGGDKKVHTYIVDFIDYDNKCVYEVKPNSLKSASTNIAKYNALVNWCENNNYKCEYIDENYFKTNKFNVSLLKYTDNIYKDKLVHILNKYYPDFIYEN